MINTTSQWITAIDSKVRTLKGKVQLYDSNNTLIATYRQNDKLKQVEIQRTGEDSKFFGFGVSHKCNVKLIDVSREINISTSNYFKIELGVLLPNGRDIEYCSFPKMYVTEVNRDENTNELSITAYDKLHAAGAHVFNELTTLMAPYTIRDVLEKIAGVINLQYIIPTDTAFDLSYAKGANFEGTETFRTVLTAAAEATQTIYYIDCNDKLVFKRLDISGNPVKTITKDRYITLDSGENRRLQTVCNTNELEDSTSASTTSIGTTQYIRDNPFWELRDDIATLVDAALAVVGNMTINQFECVWRGDLALEIGDKIAFTTKDNKTVTSYLFNDTITYNGTLSQKTEWKYNEDNTETESNPTSLGETIKQTYARVDKANKEIQLIAGETSGNSEAISALQINTGSVSASVSKIEETVTEGFKTINDNVSALTSKVNAQITAEDVKLEISKQMSNGVNKVTTTTGFTFDETGLTISKTGSEMETNIDEDGISVFRDNTEVLTADNKGVIAYNLHAKTYLIIGENSRLEDWENDGTARTGCFWIGG